MRDRKRIILRDSGSQELYPSVHFGILCAQQGVKRMWHLTSRRKEGENILITSETVIPGTAGANPDKDLQTPEHMQTNEPIQMNIISAY